MRNEQGPLQSNKDLKNLKLLSEIKNNRKKANVFKNLVQVWKIGNQDLDLKSKFLIYFALLSRDDYSFRMRSRSEMSGCVQWSDNILPGSWNTCPNLFLRYFRYLKNFMGLHFKNHKSDEMNTLKFKVRYIASNKSYSRWSWLVLPNYFCWTRVRIADVYSIRTAFEQVFIRILYMLLSVNTKKNSVGWQTKTNIASKGK